MGSVNEGDFSVELENGVEHGSIEMGFESEPETIAIVDAVKVLLQGLGEDIDREGIRKTPLRVAKALRDGTRGYRQKTKDIVQGALFPEAGFDNGIGQAGGAGGLVVVRDLDLFTYCESCLLPFQVKCHVGYVPSGKRVVGLSKVSRVADVFAKRLQDPQRLSDEICSALHQGINPSGVSVVLQCSHIQFPNLESVFIDSNHQGWVTKVVCSGSGVFEDEKFDGWKDFLSLVRYRGVNLDAPLVHEPNKKSWCPSISSSAKTTTKMAPAGPGMVSAVSSIIRCLGEDPSRNELAGTPNRFVKWLMNFEKTNLDMKPNGFGCRRIETPKQNGTIHFEKPNSEIKQNGIHFEKPNSEIKQNGVNFEKHNSEIKQNGFNGCKIETLKLNGHDNCYGKEISFEFCLPFWSQCEHHLLPFHGFVHIGYFGMNPIIDKSKFQSMVHFHGFKLQVQERLTRQIAESVSSLVGIDVMVVVEASHTCMISRGVEKLGSSTATIAVLGRFSTDSEARAMFLRSIPKTAF